MIEQQLTSQSSFIFRIRLCSPILSVRLKGKKDRIIDKSASSYLCYIVGGRIEVKSARRVTESRDVTRHRTRVKLSHGNDASASLRVFVPSPTHRFSAALSSCSGLTR
jgi:hypothetical protein